MSSSSLSVLITRLRDLRQEYSDLIAERRNQPPAAKAANEEEEVEAEFQRNVLTLKKKLELVKKSVPEGMPEDEDMRYIWGVAELERSLKQLHGRRDVLEKVVNYMQDQNQITQNYSQEQHLIYENFKDKVSEFESAPTQKEVGSEADKAELEAVSQKMRTTKLAYRDMRTFLGNLLPELSPEQKEDEGSKLGRFLQVLWNTFFTDGSEEYLKISHLEFDVDPSDVTLLINNDIIEQNPEDLDSVRLVDMTH